MARSATAYRIGLTACGNLMQTFYYHEGDWEKGYKLIAIIHEESLTLADKKFQEGTGINPVKNPEIKVALSPLDKSFT